MKMAKFYCYCSQMFLLLLLPNYSFSSGKFKQAFISFQLLMDFHVLKKNILFSHEINVKISCI